VNTLLEGFERMQRELREYSLVNLAQHLSEAEEWPKLFQLLDTDQYRQAKDYYDPSMHSFIMDLDLGRQAAGRWQWTYEEGSSYHSCFISYSYKDQAFAECLYADLQSKGVRCWFAPEDLKIGDHYHQRIDESIRLYDKLILILSEHAIQSAWVEREVVSAREKEDHIGHDILFPIRLDEAVMLTTRAWAADIRRRWHIGDFTRWKHQDDYQQALQRLLRDLKAEQKTAAQ
jgi:hypothetical protein